MQCPTCKYPYSEVIDTRHDDKQQNIKRRRGCLRCGLRYTTQEQIKARRPSNDKTISSASPK